MKKLTIIIALLSAMCFAKECPIVTGLSTDEAYVDDFVEIYGENFGDDPNEIFVSIMSPGYNVKIYEVSDNKIIFRFYGYHYEQNVPIYVKRNGCYAENRLTINSKGDKLPEFFNFNESDPWTSENAVLSYDSEIKDQFPGTSLKIDGSGYVVITSPSFNTRDLGRLSRQLIVYVWIPEEQENPYWWGEVQAFIDIPAAGLRNAFINSVPLTGRTPRVWNGLVFNITDDAIFNALSGDYPNAHIKFALNINKSAEKYHLEHMFFAGTLSHRIGKPVEGLVLDISSASFMSFDNIDDWASNYGELSFVGSNKSEGQGATGVQVSGYTAINSRMFQASELEVISDKISFDVFVPSSAPNENWIGNVGLSLTCAEDGILNETLGETDLYNLYSDQFNNIKFSIDEEIVSKLKQATGSCQFTVHLNAYNGSGMFLLDNMGFVVPSEEVTPKVKINIISNEYVSFNLDGESDVVDFALSTLDGVVLYKQGNITANNGQNFFTWNSAHIQDGRYIATITYKGKAYGSYIILK